jgi:hypothetical protein
MIAQQDPYIEKAVTSVYKLSEDERFRQQYEAREDFIRQQIDHDYWYDTQIKKRDEKIAEQDVALADKDARIAEQSNALADKDAALADKDAVLAEQAANLADKDARIAELERLLAEKA